MHFFCLAWPGTNSPPNDHLRHALYQTKGFPILNNQLPETCNEQYLVFIVPKNRAENFACRKPTGDAQKGFRYFLLPLDKDDNKYCPSSADI